MTSDFQSWEKDPLFSAAEQVQDSADRVESVCRAWMHFKSSPSNEQDSSTLDFRRRELSTAIGIAKWQLEEFEKEVLLLSTDTQNEDAEDETSQRRKQFIDAIRNQLFSIENALLCSKEKQDLSLLPTVHLAHEYSDQLANFLCGSRSNTGEDAKQMLDSFTSPGNRYKKMKTSCQSATSMSRSSLDCGKALFGSLDDCSSSPESCISVDVHDSCIFKDNIGNRKDLIWPTEQETDFVCFNVDQSNEIATCAAAALSGDCYNNAGTCIERPNGHRRSTSLGAGLSFCTERASLGSGLNFCTERANGNHRIASVDAGFSCCRDGSSVSEYRASPSHVISNAISNIWCSILKPSLNFRVGGPSSTGLKRWKDGECDAIDPCESLHGDIEQNCGFCLRQDSSWSEMQTLQSFRKGIYIRRLAQATFTILAAVGLVGLYLH